jgi:hypothetical protein
VLVVLVATENFFLSVGFSILNGTKARDELESEGRGDQNLMTSPGA